MRLFKNLFSTNLFLIVFFAFITTSCGSKGGEATKTLLEILSKNWKISRVTINGMPDNAGNYANYRVVFQQNGTYAVTLGNSPVNIVINPANNGRWEISGNETSITFDKGTANEFIVTLVTKMETGFSVKFKVPKSINKTEPEYTIEYVPVS